jgi:carbonic anhydrase
MSRIAVDHRARGRTAGAAALAWLAAGAMGLAAAQTSTTPASRTAAPAAPATPAAATGPAVAPAAVTTTRPAPGATADNVDPLDRLRERLTRQLGATEAAPGSKTQPTVMRVENEAPGELRIQAAPMQPRPALAPRPGGSGAVSGAGSRAGTPAQPAAKARPGTAAHAAGAASGGAAHAAGPAWSYSGPTGPQAWGQLSPMYSLCERGRRQSPIDIRDGLRVDLEPVQFDYKPGFFSIIDNGHTVDVQLAAGSAIELGGRRYELAGFHFHLPSEERVEGRGFEMSIHLVHRDARGRLAVVALLAEEGEEHPAVQQVWNHLPLEKHELVAAPVEFDPATLLPSDRRYYTYMGSLTTPPCTEGVLWIVLQQPIRISPEQRAILVRLYPMNARPVQPSSERLIKQSR